MNGGWVFVCGPSGAGKDSVIGWAMVALAHEHRVAFARRLATRSAGPGSADQEIGRNEFAARLAAGRLAWHWHAHGTNYGIDGAEAEAVARGQVVVVNGSREHAAGLDRLRHAISVVLVTASAEQLAARLRSRGREDATAIDRRLARNGALPSMDADLVIQNDGELADAGRRLATFLSGSGR